MLVSYFCIIKIKEKLWILYKNLLSMRERKFRHSIVSVALILLLYTYYSNLPSKDNGQLKNEESTVAIFPQSVDNRNRMQQDEMSGTNIGLGEFDNFKLEFEKSDTLFRTSFPLR